MLLFMFMFQYNCLCCWFVFFFKQKTAYEMRISDWSSDVCSSDLDIRVLSATADLDTGGRGFFITFTIEEGPRYRFGAIDIETALPSLNVDAIQIGRASCRERVCQYV